MKQSNFVRLRDAMGHGFFTVVVAKMRQAYLATIPDKNVKADYNAAQQATIENFMFFERALKVPFADRSSLNCSDPVAELTSGTIDNGIWAEFARTRLIAKPDALVGIPAFDGLKGKKNVLWVPQKFITDGLCGLSAGQQSVPLEAFEFLKAKADINLVFGQHFNKVSDLANVEKTCAEYQAYLPGQTEHPEVLGIRGVQHKLYYNMYQSLKASIGIAGTHTWYMLTMFPEIPQVILYNKKGVERWDLIGQAYRDAGYQIYPLGFDETTDFAEYSKEMEILLNNIL